MSRNLVNRRSARHRYPGRSLLLGAALLAGTGGLDAASSTAGDPTVLERAQLRPPVHIVHDGQTRSLSANASLGAGDRVNTGEHGRAAFVFPGGGYLALGADASLRVHSVDARPGSKTVVRLVLDRGVLRVDPRNGEDLRLNAGELRLRVYDADVWIGVETAGDTVCLLRGAVEFQYASGGGDRIDHPGECVFMRPGSAALRYTPTQQILASKLNKADLGSASPSASLPAPAAAPAPIARPAPARPAPAVRAAPTPASTASTAPPSARSLATHGWTVVVLSLTDPESAELEAEDFRDRGFDAHTFAQAVDGRVLHRIGIGRFATREQARQFAVNVKTRLHIDQAWVAQY